MLMNRLILSEKYSEELKLKNFRPFGKNQQNIAAE